jgi:hypothetical protein
MALAYESAEVGGPLRQGEVLGPIVHHQAVFPPRRLPAGTNIAVRSTVFDLVVVLSPDCDLTWDHDMRFLDFWDDDENVIVHPNEHTRGVDQVLMCRLHNYGEIRPRFHNQGNVWGRVVGNQDERYHHLDGAPVAESPGFYLHPLFIDFKKATSMPTDELYDGVLSGDIERVALLPAYYIHDLIHRFYGFLSRVALPDL